MSRAAEQVQAFRQVIDGVVETNVARVAAEARALVQPVRATNYDPLKVAQLHGTTFARVEQEDVRPGYMSRFGEGTNWGTVEHIPHFLQYSGHMAIISAESEPDTLLRRWILFEGSAPPRPLTSVSRLLCGAEVGLALTVVRSQLDDREDEMGEAWEQIAAVSRREEVYIQGQIAQRELLRQETQVRWDAVTAAERAARLGTPRPSALSRVWKTARSPGRAA